MNALVSKQQSEAVVVEPWLESDVGQEQNLAFPESSSVTDRPQAMLGNASVASTKSPAPESWLQPGVSNSALLRLIGRRQPTAQSLENEPVPSTDIGEQQTTQGASQGPGKRKSQHFLESSRSPGPSFEDDRGRVQGDFPPSEISADAQAISSQPTGGPVAASTENTFLAFANASASEIVGRIGQAGDRFRNRLQQDRQAIVASAPAVRVAIPRNPAGEQRAATAGPLAPGKLPSAESIVLGAATPSTPLSPEETQVAPQPPGNQLHTDSGPPPTFRADGEAAPDRMIPAMDTAATTSRQAADQILNEIQGNTSAERMIAKPVDRSETIDLPESTADPAVEPSVEMLEYLQTDVDPTVRGMADADFAPLLERTLANPKAAVRTAAAERDRRREQAFAEANAEAEAASRQACAEQNAAIIEGTAAVEAEKRKGMDERQAKLAEFDADVQSQYRSQQEEIDTVIETEQARADQEIADGNESARKLAEKAREDEAQERAARERDKPKKKKDLLGRITSWFKKAIKKWTDALVKAVQGIFDKARKLVSDALAAAKQVAVGIIRKLRDQVVGLITSFAAGLKLLVGALLVAFPAIRDRVNSAIDAAVEKTIETVDAIATKLEDAVVQLIDRVEAVVTGILDLFELAIVTQLQIAGALLSGEFLQAARILFLAACRAVGIPGEEFLSVLEDAGEAFLDIIKHPARFLKSLVGAVGKGISNFASNFRVHFLGGITGWLFGTLAQAGIELPRSFSPKSIFRLLLQILGLTYQYIREVAVRVVGEQNVAALEYVMAEIKTLVIEGPGQIWNWILDKAAVIQQKIIDTVSEWLITQLIMKAATKLATMFTPVGAFVQAVLMMYNTIMFFIERIQQIFAWVQSITGSFTRMARGMVSAAANWIEQAMARTIPLIIAFLARLVGVGGIGAKIQSMVGKIRQPIDQAIVFVIEKLVSLGQKVWGGIKATGSKIANWWNTREEFQDAAGTRHTLFLKRVGGRTEVMVASKVRKYEELISQIESNYDLSSSAERKAALDAAKIAYRLVRKRIDELERRSDQQPDQQELAELRILASRSQAIIVESGPEAEAGSDSVIDWVHVALDAAGLFPALGIIPDGINTGLYLIRGNWEEAGFSAAAMVPIFGQGATATKHGVRVTKEALEKTGKNRTQSRVKQLKDHSREVTSTNKTKRPARKTTNDEFAGPEATKVEHYFRETFRDLAKDPEYRKFIKAKYKGVVISANGDVFGPYSTLRRFVKAHELSDKKWKAQITAQSHHLLEQRFANKLGIDENEGISVVLEASEHANKITAAIRARISNSLTKEGPPLSVKDAFEIHAEVYRNYNVSNWIGPLRDFLKGKSLL